MDLGNLLDAVYASVGKDLKTRKLNTVVRDATKWSFDLVKNFFVLVALNVIAFKNGGQVTIIVLSVLGAGFCFNILSPIVDFITERLDAHVSNRNRHIVFFVAFIPTYGFFNYMLGKAMIDFVELFARIQMGIPLKN